jgi:predicted membrane protein
MTSTRSNSQTDKAHKWLISILGSSRSPTVQSNNAKIVIAMGSCTIDLTALDFALSNINVDVYVLAGSAKLIVPQDVGISSTGMIILRSRRIENHAIQSPLGHLNINCIGALGSLHIKHK